MLEREDAGDVFVQDVVLAPHGGQGSQLLDMPKLCWTTMINLSANHGSIDSRVVLPLLLPLPAAGRWRTP
ncbi:hypothetical protein ACIQUY_14240 [Streptomyces sp. NPDC090231]|uniref:hypothetical protein n=1 Tax=unclassified Streptomyces TaxID=2593676 RepID=UPI003810F27A